MMKRFLLGILFWLTTVSGQAGATLMHSCDFESGNYCGLADAFNWSAYPGNYLGISTEQAYEGTHSVKFTRNASQCTEDFMNCAHVQLLADEAAPVAIGGTYWIGLAVFIPANFQNVPTDYYMDFIDFHGASDCPPQSGYPMGTFLFHDGGAGTDIVIMSRTDCTSGWNVVGSGTVYFNKGQWNRVVIQVKFSIGSDGFQKWWINKDSSAETPDINYSGPTTYPKGQYIKFGLYGRSTSATTIYVDNWKIGGANSSFAEVSPSGGEPLPDTTAPDPYNYAPTGTQPTGTQQAAMTWLIPENGTCKWGASNDAPAATSSTAYASLAHTATGAGTQSHSATLTGLTDGSDTYVYIRCTDGTNTATTSSTHLISVDDNPPTGNTNLLTAATYSAAESDWDYASLYGDWCAPADMHDGTALAGGDGDNSPNCMCVGVDQASSVTLVWDFQRPMDLTALDYYGDAGDHGTGPGTGWGCADFDFYVYKGGAWVADFTARDCTSDSWQNVDLSDHDDVWKVKFVIRGNSLGTAFQEAIVTGVNAEYTPPAPGDLKLSGMEGGFAGAADTSFGVVGAADVIYIAQ